MPHGRALHDLGSPFSPQEAEESQPSSQLWHREGGCLAPGRKANLRGVGWGWLLRGRGAGSVLAAQDKPFQRHHVAKRQRPLPPQKRWAGASSTRWERKPSFSSGGVPKPRSAGRPPHPHPYRSGHSLGPCSFPPPARSRGRYSPEQPPCRRTSAPTSQAGARSRTPILPRSCSWGGGNHARAWSEQRTGEREPGLGGGALRPRGGRLPAPRSGVWIKRGWGLSQSLRELPRPPSAHRETVVGRRLGVNEHRDKGHLFARRGWGKSRHLLPEQPGNKRSVVAALRVDCACGGGGRVRRKTENAPIGKETGTKSTDARQPVPTVPAQRLCSCAPFPGRKPCGTYF